jgi:hypothetical protein
VTRQDVLREVNHPEGPFTKLVADAVELLARCHCLVELGKARVDHRH